MIRTNNELIIFKTEYKLSKVLHYIKYPFYLESNQRAITGSLKLPRNLAIHFELMNCMVMKYSKLNGFDALISCVISTQGYYIYDVLIGLTN
jgi:hypothetical protein